MLLTDLPRTKSWGCPIRQPIYYAWSLVFGLPLFLFGCFQWRAEMPPAEFAIRRADTEDGRHLWRTAERIAARARDRVGLERAMAACEHVLAQDPAHYAALVALSNQKILMGAAYAADPEAKEALFRGAMALAERAMLTNAVFRERVQGGAAPWEAADALGAAEMEAMLFWTTALLYQFKDVMSWPGKVVNIRWVARTGPFLERMYALDPDWGGGAIQFTQSLYYGILPWFMGGDDDRSGALLDEAVAYGEPWMLSRWGRAKYFRVRDGDREGFREDCLWVLARDPAQVAEAYAWRVYFQEDARAMLANIDHYF